MVLHRQRKNSRRRNHWAFLCTFLHGDITFHSYHSVLCNLAAPQGSLWLFLPDPRLFHSTEETWCILRSLSAGWRSHLQGKHCRCEHVPSLKDQTNKGPNKEEENLRSDVRELSSRIRGAIESCERQLLINTSTQKDAPQILLFELWIASFSLVSSGDQI